MDCVIEGNCVRAFGKAIHALSRIGDELWLDPVVKGVSHRLQTARSHETTIKRVPNELKLALRAVNSTHSAYACFLFSPLFFQRYRPEAGTAQGCGTFKCKLVMKSVLPLFRCLASIERNVDRCEIKVSIMDARVVFQFHCRHGMIKTHNLSFCESEAMQAVFPSHLCPNVLKAQARLFCDMVRNFPVCQEEVTLSITPSRVNLRNHIEEGSNNTKTMYTDMSLHLSEFDYYQFGVDSDITFCLKELRGFLSFAESHCLPVSVHFGAAGKPVCFSVEDLVLEARVVLATLTDLESTAPSQTWEAQVTATPRCGKAASLPEGSCEADSGPHQDIPTRNEFIASSQGSPLMQTTSMGVVFGTDQLDTLYVPLKELAKASTIPMSELSFLLFGALSSQRDEDDCGSLHSVLACSSDTEEGENNAKQRAQLI